LKYPKYKYFYAGIDFIVLTLAFLSAKLVYFIIHPSISFKFDPFSLSDISLDILAIFIMIFVFHYNNLYKLNVFLTKASQLSLIIKSLFYGIFILIILSFFLKSDLFPDSRLYILLFFFNAVILFLVIRVLIMNFLYANHLSKSFLERKILIIGAGKSGKMFAQKLFFENIIGARIIGFVDDKIEMGTKIFRHLIVLGNTNEIGVISKSMMFDEIVICIDNINYDNLLDIIDKCQKTKATIKVTSELFQIIPEKLFSEEYSNIPVVNVSKNLNVKLYYLAKRIIDYTGALIGILIISPFFVATSLLIKLSSKGPVIFKQVRIGKDGKPFNFYKFRTMRSIEGEDNERKNDMIRYMKSSTNGEKIVNNNRITRIGKFLRKYSFDELPQFINVIKGDMSLVGPRPCLPYEYEHYDEWQKRRLSVLPGCTGLWQVSGRSNVNFNDSIVIDLYYINNISPWLDLQLIFKTVPVMVFAKGGK